MFTRRSSHPKQNKTKKNIAFFYNKAPRLIKINNIYLLLLPIKESNATQMECSIFGGNFIETNKNVGIAHLLEHLLIISSKYCGSQNCSSYLDNYGIEYNASTHNMFTNYWLRGLPEYNDVMLQYITSAIFSPKITPELIEKEKKVVRHELKSYMNSPSWKLLNLIYKSFYSKPGLKNDMDYKLQIKLLNKIGMRELNEHIKEIITKRCILFTVSGKFNKKKVVDHFKKITFPLQHKKCALQNVDISRQCYTFQKKIIYVRHKNAENTNISIVFPIDIKQGDKYGIYLGFLSSMFGGDLNSILLKRLREELNLIYGLNVSTKTDLCGTSLLITTSTQDKYVKKVIYEIFLLIHFYIHHLIPYDKFSNEKLKYKLMLNQLCITNPDAVSVFYTHQYFWQLNKKTRKIWTLKEISRNIENLSPYTIKALVKKTFNINNCIIGYIGKTNVNLSFQGIDKYISSKNNNIL